MAPLPCCIAAGPDSSENIQKWIHITCWDIHYIFLAFKITKNTNCPTLSSFFMNNKKNTIFGKSHNVWKLLKMSHFSFLFLAFPTIFRPLKIDLYGNTVWPQASGFQKIAKLTIFGHWKFKRSSLPSQCWMRLFLWFSNTVSASITISYIFWALEMFVCGLPWLVLIPFLTQNVQFSITLMINVQHLYFPTGKIAESLVWLETKFF